MIYNMSTVNGSKIRSFTTMATESRIPRLQSSTIIVKMKLNCCKKFDVTLQVKIIPLTLFQSDCIKTMV
jgi:hypothetical protein